MTSPRSLTFEYPSTPDAVAALLRDPDFLRSRCEAAGESNVDVRVEETARGLRVVVARDKAVDVPAFAKRIVSPQSRIVDDTIWTREGDRWIAQYAIEIKGVPGDVRGRSELSPSAAGCRHDTVFEVKSRVPLLASKVESFVADRIEETLKANANRNADHLRS